MEGKTTGYALWGGFGGHNLGDEAILWAMSRLIKKLDPDARIYVLVRGHLTSSVEAVYRALGLTPVSLLSLACLRVLRETRVVGAGGQLLHDKTVAFPLGWTSLLLFFNRLLGKRPLILCIGAEPLQHASMKILAKYCYSLAAFCTCRDPESAAVARNLGIPNGKVLTTKDTVFSLDENLFPKWKSSPNDAPRITLVVAYDSTRSHGDVESVSSLIHDLLNTGCLLSLVSHDLRIEYDLGLLIKVEKLFIDDPRVKICRPQTVADVFNVYANSDAVVSTRMHPLILSSLAGTLAIADSNDAKVRSLVAGLGIPALCPSDTPGKKAQSILSFLSSRQTYLQVIASRIPEFRASVERVTAEALKG
jgi:polysaccharide pyruvyl transferase WcaK-like protein